MKYEHPYTDLLSAPGENNGHMHNTLVAVLVEINSDSTIALGADSPL